MRRYPALFAAVLLLAVGCTATAPSPSTSTGTASQGVGSPSPSAGSQPPGSEVNLVLVTGINHAGPWLANALNVFQQEHPGWTVELQLVQAMEAQIPGIQRLVNAGTGVDVFYLGGDAFTTGLASGELFRDITDEVTFYDRFDEDLFYDSFYEVDGRRYGVPVAPAGVSMLSYNAALFDELGIAYPSTYAELTAAAPTLKAAGVAPFAGFGSAWPFYAVMTMHMMFDAVSGNNAVQVIRDTLKGTTKFTDQVYRDAWTCALGWFNDEMFQVEPGENGALWKGATEKTAVALLSTREVGIAWTGSSRLPALKDSAASNPSQYQIGLGVPPLCPNAPAGARSRPVSYLPNMWSIYKGSAHPAESLALLDYLSSDEVATAWLTATGDKLTVNKNVKPVLTDAIDEQLAPLFQDGVVDLTWLLGLDLSIEWANQFQKVVDGTQTIDQGLEALEQWRQANPSKVVSW